MFRSYARNVCGVSISMSVVPSVPFGKRFAFHCRNPIYYTIAEPVDWVLCSGFSDSSHRGETDRSDPVAPLETRKVTLSCATSAAPNLLLRAQVELPDGFRLATEEFREGWNFSRSIDAFRLEKKILNYGWKLHQDWRPDHGVTGWEIRRRRRIGNALLLMPFRHISENFNAVEVEHIEQERNIRVLSGQSWNLSVSNSAGCGFAGSRSCRLARGCPRANAIAAPISRVVPRIPTARCQC